MTLSRIASVAAFAAVSAFTLAAPARADFHDKKPITYTVDGATPKGYFKVTTEAINALVRETYPGTDATFKPGSPAGGILDIATGKSSFVFNGAPAEITYALQGKPPFKTSLKGKFHFVMMLHRGLVVHSIMTKDWAEKNGIKSFEDIARKQPYMRLAVNQPANLQSTVTMYKNLFDIFGIDEKKVTNNNTGAIRANSATGMAGLRDGKIDVFINGGFIPTAELVDISRGRPLMWISGGKDKMEAAAKRWGIDVVTVPKSAYPFMTKDEITHAIYSSVLAGDHVSEETVYKFTKALIEHADRVAKIHPSLAHFSKAEAIKNPTGLDIHKGALRYYREIGLIK